jgi:secondary thiamine-phosphate synthase enzyme
MISRMKVVQLSIEVQTRGRGTHAITDLVEGSLGKSCLQQGIASVFCRHTSCSLVIMENASPEVHRDLEKFMDRIVPPDRSYEHNSEGPDDMPSHIKTALTRTSETIPFANGKLQLGAWQGIYLWEHRTAPHARVIEVSFIGS